MNNRLFWILSALALTECTYFIAREQGSVSKPKFAQPIVLLDARQVSKSLQEKYPNKIAPAVLAWLASTESHDMLEEAFGRQLTCTAHDKKRKEIYSGQLLQPQYLVLTFSGKTTLEETVQSLSSQGLAHHFIIDTNGNTHPITSQNETMEQALMHRFYSVGLCNHVVNGFYEQRDMNSASISISIVGDPEQACSKFQEESLAVLIAYLQQEYQIRPDQVLDYGCIACFTDCSYGRRKPNHLLPWKKLTEQGLATYPINYQKFAPAFSGHQAEKAIFASLALRKIGYACPITYNESNQDFKKALTVFQQHAQADMTNGTITDITLQMLIDMICQHEKYNPKLKEIAPIVQ